MFDKTNKIFTKLKCGNMKRFLLLFTLSIVIFWGCVDDYQDANPPALLDAPAVHTLTVSDDLITDVGQTTLTIVVTDAPAGLDSVGVNAVNTDGEAIGGTFNVTTAFAGITSGNIDVTYQPAAGYSGTAVLQAQVFDAQVDEDGDDASKGSVIQTIEVTVICGSIAGVYSVDGNILVDDFGSGPYSSEETLILADCSVSGAYAVSDITGGLWAQDYADAYGSSARAAVLEIDFASGDVTWTGVSDQFGGTIIQDPAQPTSTYDATAGTITVYWTATGFGERGVTTYTAQ